MRVAIIGAGGFIGQALARRCAQAGHEVHAFARREVPLAADVVQHRLDVLVERVVLPANTEAVFYLAQSPAYREFPRRADDLFGVNSWGPLKAATAALDVGARCFCFASTGNVYKPAFAPLDEEHPVRRDNAYALSKVVAEESLALFRPALNVVSARIFGAFGPGQAGMLPPRIADRVRQRQPITLDPIAASPGDDGGLRVSFCFVEDLAAMLERLSVLGVSGQTLPPVVNLAGPEPISLRRLAVEIGNVVGDSPIFERGTRPREFDLVADTARMIDLLAPRFTPLGEAMARTFAPRSA